MRRRALRWALIAAVLCLLAWMAAEILLDDIPARLKPVLFLLCAGSGAMVMSLLLWDEPGDEYTERRGNEHGAENHEDERAPERGNGREEL